MRLFGYILLVLGGLGLIYFSFAYDQWHGPQMTQAPGQVLFILINDRVCGCICCGVAAIVGTLLLLTATLEMGITDFRRQLNDIHATFATANRETIEQNDDIIRNATDLKREREAGNIGALPEPKS